MIKQSSDVNRDYGFDLGKKKAIKWHMQSSSFLSCCPKPLTNLCKWTVLRKPKKVGETIKFLDNLFALLFVLILLTFVSFCISFFFFPKCLYISGLRNLNTKTQILTNLEKRTRLERKSNSLKNIPFLEPLCTWVIWICSKPCPGFWCNHRVRMLGRTLDTISNLPIL